MFYTTLPQSIIGIIYTYDTTYHLIFNDTIKQIYTFGFKTRLQKTKRGMRRVDGQTFIVTFQKKKLEEFTTEEAIEVEWNILIMVII